MMIVENGLEKTIKVSVCVVTYNQKCYIRECLESLINQDVNFNYEIIVGDDASTDGTADIVKEYAAKYPEIIVPVLHRKNMGAVANMVAVYRLAKGGYIAHMDGDDFALPGKLRKQVLKLDENLGCFICSHDAIVVDNLSQKLSSKISRYKESVNTLDDLYKRLPFFTHSTKMFRNDASSSYYDTLSNESIDIEVHVEQAKKGNIYHIDECLGGYRKFVGVSSSGSKVNNLIPQAIGRIFNDALSVNRSGLSIEELKKVYANAIFNFSYQSAFFGRRVECRKYVIESIAIKLVSAYQVGFLALTFIPYATTFITRIRNRFKSD